MSEPIDLETLSATEAVAMATLLGCEFWEHAYVEGKPVWHVTSGLHTLHPIEQRQADKTGLPGYRSKARLARVYLEWYIAEHKKRAA